MTTLAQRLFLPNQGLLFDLEQLYHRLETVPGRRKRRGRRYPFAALLMDWGAGQIGGTGEPPRQRALGQATQTRMESAVPIEAADDATL